MNAPLADVIESFFRANYDLSPKTERWYRQNLRAFDAFVVASQRRAAVLQDVNKAMVDAFLKRRRTIPTRKYPGGSPFAVRAAAVTLKRFASYLAVDGILADVGGISVLRHVKRGKVDDDVRRPLSDADQASAINGASRLGGVPRAVCVLGFGSGLRLNELREARVGDLDLERGEFHVRPETSKFGKGRTVFLHPAPRATLIVISVTEVRIESRMRRSSPLERATYSPRTDSRNCSSASIAHRDFGRSQRT